MESQRDVQRPAESGTSVPLSFGDTRSSRSSFSLALAGPPSARGPATPRHHQLVPTLEQREDFHLSVSLNDAI